jgi:hypothetical protein
MDYGSGFWTYEDAAPVAKMAELMGYENVEAISKYRDAKLFEEEQTAFCRDHNIGWFNRGIAYTESVIHYPDGSTRRGYREVPAVHEHEFATNGRCLWPMCEEKSP